jgi:hypothetical protein
MYILSSKSVNGSIVLDDSELLNTIGKLKFHTKTVQTSFDSKFTSSSIDLYHS